ncbi:MAG: hypothetical protein AAFP69_22020, partial [Planctomycetota bacterium]
PQGVKHASKSASDAAADSLIVHCSSGHRIRAGNALRGQTLPCPKCGGAVRVPMASESSDPLSDTGIMRILGDLPPLPQQATSRIDDNQPTAHVCPRCGTANPPTAAICRNCNCYTGSLPNLQRQSQ